MRDIMRDYSPRINTNSIHLISAIVNSGGRVWTNLRKPKIAAATNRENVRVLANRALVEAAPKFYRLHPEWRTSLFDKHFMAKWADLLAYCWMNQETYPDPRSIARGWAQQLWLRDEKKEKLIEEVIPAVSDFIDLFDTELRACN